MVFMLMGGNRKNSKKKSVSAMIIHETLRKGGKINEQTFQKILNAKLKEARTNSLNNMFDAKMSQNGGRRSANAQRTIDMMNDMFAARDAKKDSKQVIIVARRYHNGKIDDRGRIFDVAGNMVAKVNVKNGFMASINGDYMGRYDAKSAKTYATITGAIEKNSPYLIAQRAVVERQKAEANNAALYGGGSSGNNSLDVWSRTPTDIWGRSKVDIWGRPATDVWGRTQTDSWGNQQVDIWGNQI
ncbi:MAG: hypothetical protein ABL857_06315 [Rickettsiales bacterium]